MTLNLVSDFFGEFLKQKLKMQILLLMYADDEYTYMFNVYVKAWKVK